MKNKSQILLCLAFLACFAGKAQNTTFSPYSRYGIGEMNPTSFVHNLGMGGAGIALRADSTMPVFINTGNPASYSLIKLTVLEVGGAFNASNFKGQNSSLRKWGTSFAYGALGFPIRSNGGACFGIMPFSSVGYDTKSSVTEKGIGEVNYLYSGSGGLNKAFIGYGIMPFSRKLNRLKRKQLYAPDSLRLSHQRYMRREFVNKFLSDFSLGFNANYIFGNINNTTRVTYPSSILYTQAYRARTLNLGGFTGNFGAQSAITIDSVSDPKGRAEKIKNELNALTALNIYSKEVLKIKKDSLLSAIPLNRRALKERVKFTFGYFMGLNNPIKTNYSSVVYNYVLNGLGAETVRDTSLYDINKQGSISLPMEQGFGIGFKKGERINLVADFAITDWQNFKYLDNLSEFKRNYRVAAGVNYVPEKYAAGRGALLRRANYRFGISYQTGYIEIKNSLLFNYSISAGVGLPVGIGRLSSMVNITATYGQMSTGNATLIKENYWRINFGFTFCDRWFQKYKED